MEYRTRLEEYDFSLSDGDIATQVAAAREESVNHRTPEICRICLECLDLTSLNASDSEKSIREFAQKAVGLSHRYPEVSGMASVCVYPAFVDTAGIAIGDSGLRITSVAGGFPSSQTYLEVKMLEVAMVIENGADEVDIVMNVGQFLDGNYEQAATEIGLIREETGNDITLKVIVESGELGSYTNIYKASMLAMLAGADFVKTSTGKTAQAATPEAAAVMCHAIRDYHSRTDRKIGIKVAGGIKNVEDAALYYTIVKTLLGEEWLNPSLFRIGASSLANSLLEVVTGKETRYF